ncbi:MAG: glycosyltransferase [Acidobacteriia bacterium]|nr:glycosyltransferase [Terriglobia bacterium]
MPLGLAIVAIWLYLLLGRGGFWRMRDRSPEEKLPSDRRSRPYAGPDGARAPHIVAVIPARNEAAVVGRAIQSLAQQEYAGEFQIVLVDDDSTDGTDAAARLAAPAGLLTVIRAAALPRDWSGKLWAVSEGIRYAQSLDPDYFLLTDADIVHPRDNLATLVMHAESAGYDLVSYMATLECRTLAERALIPAFVFFFFMLYPPAWISSARHATAGAAGGCMLIRRAALESIGGIGAIAGELIDDCALARAVKQGGGKVWLGLSAGTLSIREYATFGEIGGMISRTAFTQLNHSIPQLIGTVLGLAITYLAAPLLAIAAPRSAGYARWLGTAAWLLMSIAYFPVLRYYRRSPLRAPLLPLVATFYLGATIHSAVCYWRGRGGVWKGRVQNGTENFGHE